jgi:hypothetical protein
MVRGEAAEEHEANWATEGLFVIADAIKAKRGDSYSLVGNSGGDDFVCPTFSMRAYCWCEGDRHPGKTLDGGYSCPPNFEFPASGFVLRWYKYAGRGQNANRPKPPGMLWEVTVAQCIMAVSTWKP